MDGAVGPDRVIATLALGDFYLRRGRWQEARDCVRDLVGAKGTNGLEALRIRAQALDGEGRRKQAAGVYGELASLDPVGVRGLTAAAAKRRTIAYRRDRPQRVAAARCDGSERRVCARREALRCRDFSRPRSAARRRC